LVQLDDAGVEPSVPPSPFDGCPPDDAPLPDELADDAVPPEDEETPDELPDDEALPEDDEAPDDVEEDVEPPDEEELPDDEELPEDDELLEDEALVPEPLSPHPFASERSKPRSEAGSRCRIVYPSIRLPMQAVTQVCSASPSMPRRHLRFRRQTSARGCVRRSPTSTA
jgi:hypothetical protein